MSMRVFVQERKTGMFNKKLRSLVPEARKYSIACAVLQWFALLSTIVLMFTIAAFIGSLATSKSFFVRGEAIVLGVGMGALVIRLVCQSLAQRLSIKAAGAAKRAIRLELYTKLVRLGPAYAEVVPTSEALQLSVEGCEQLESYFGSYLSQMFYAFVAPVTLFVCLAPFSLVTAGVLLVCVLLIPLSMLGVQHIAKRAVRRHWGAYTNLGASFLENLQGLTTLKIFNIDKKYHEDMNKEAESFRIATMKLLSVQLNSITLMDVIAFGGAALGIAVAVIELATGHISLSVTLAFVLLSSEFFIPVRALGSLFHTAMNGMAAAEKIGTILDKPEPPQGSLDLTDKQVSIVCDSLSYSYDGQRRVLNDVHFEAPAGSFTGIVGESGSGKSTLAGIMSGHNAGFQGSVTLGGVAMAQLRRSSLSHTITTVSASSYLFSGTIRSNLVMANSSVDDKALWASLAHCRIDAFVQEMGGLDTVVLEHGANLSGGQRQRLALARALLHDTPIYIFDEATSNIDAESEQAILSVINDLAKVKTVIMISHRLLALAHADCIYVLEGGSVVQWGTHESLQKQKGVYRHLWNQQSDLERFAKEAYEKRSEAPQVDKLSSTPSVASCLPPDDLMKAEHYSVAANQPAPLASDTPFPTRSAFRIMARLVHLVTPLVPWLVLAVIGGVLGFGAAIFFIVFGGIGSASAAGSMPSVSLAVAMTGMFVCAFLRGSLRYGEQLCNHYVAFKVLAMVRDQVYGKLRTLAPAKLEGRNKGNLVSMVTSDVELLEVFYAHTLSPAFIALIVSVAMSAFIAWLSPVLGLLAFVGYAVVGVVVPLVASRASGKGGLALRQRIGDFNSFVLESLRGLRETLQYEQEAHCQIELSTQMSEIGEVEMRLKGRSGIALAITNAVVLAFSIALFLVAGALVLSGEIDFSAALVAILAFISSFGPVIAVANLGSTLQQTLASGARVLDLLDEVPQTQEISKGSMVGSFKGLTARQVNFSYAATPILHDINVDISVGSIVHLAGCSGSGKSTFCKLLMRFWDVDGGSIKISSCDVRALNTESLRATQSYMTQDTYLFQGSIRDNILLAKRSATEDELAQACAQASLEALLKRLPQGLDTQVGELGEALSGGERQRIGLARIFLHNAPLIILDEPTSNLDSLNEAAILRALSHSREGKTIILVSHRLSTAALADITYTVEQGRLS